MLQSQNSMIVNVEFYNNNIIKNNMFTNIIVIKDFIILFSLYFLLSQEMIKDFFAL